MIKSTSSCGGENETAIDGEVDKEKDRCGIVRAESAIIEMDELLVECCCVRAKCNGAGSNGYDGNNIELALLFLWGGLRGWCKFVFYGLILL